jgi:hypothetical protein
VSGNHPQWPPTPTTSSTRSSSRPVCLLRLSSSFLETHQRSFSNVSTTESLADFTLLEVPRSSRVFGARLEPTLTSTEDTPELSERLVRPFRHLRCRLISRRKELPLVPSICRYRVWCHSSYSSRIRILWSEMFSPRSMLCSQVNVGGWIP